MTDKELEDKIEKLSKINEELLAMVLEQSRYIREMENMQKVRRMEKV